jgi:hypothetical protein
MAIIEIHNPAKMKERLYKLTVIIANAKWNSSKCDKNNGDLQEKWQYT